MINIILNANFYFCFFEFVHYPSFILTLIFFTYIFLILLLIFFFYFFFFISFFFIYYFYLTLLTLEMKWRIHSREYPHFLHMFLSHLSLFSSSPTSLISHSSLIFGWFCLLHSSLSFEEFSHFIFQNENNI